MLYISAPGDMGLFKFELIQIGINTREKKCFPDLLGTFQVPSVASDSSIGQQRVDCLDHCRGFCWLAPPQRSSFHFHSNPDKVGTASPFRR